MSTSPVETISPAPGCTVDDAHADQDIMARYYEDDRRRHHPANPRAGRSRHPSPLVRRYTMEQLNKLASSRSVPDIVKEWLPAEALAVVAGKSHVGKSPWAYQLGCCAAAGIPFLDQPTERTRVLYADFENGARRITALGERLCRILGLSAAPQELMVTQDRPPSGDLETLKRWFDAALAGQSFGLIILDSLKSFWPRALKTDDSSDFMNVVRDVKDKYHVSVLFVHHQRKEDQNSMRSAQGSAIEDLSEEMSGSLSIVNQSDVRIMLWQLDDDTELMMRGFCRMEDAFGPIHLERDRDEQDLAPLGYKHLIDSGKLSGELKAFYDALPARFDAAQVQTAAATSRATCFRRIKELIQAGYVLNDKGSYSKVPAETVRL